MSGPFRELFVELPGAVFDTLKGIGEQAVREAEKRTGSAAARYSMTPIGAALDLLRRDASVRALCERYGCSSITADHSECFAEVSIWAALTCGHGLLFGISDRCLLLGSSPISGLLDAMDKAFARERYCFCVQMPTAQRRAHHRRAA